jgi:hypothetical protein
MTLTQEVVVPGEPAPVTTRRRRPRWPAAASLILLALAVLALLGGERAPIDGLGLLPALPWGYLAAVLAMVALLVVGLLRRSSAPWTLYLQVAVITTALTLGPTLLEPFARFPTAYTHAGFVDYIQRNSAVLLDYDARFSWPAFFATGAMFVRASGLEPDQLLRFTPVLLDLGLLAAFTALASRFIRSPRRLAFSMFLFVVFNWVGQDYFAPQGFGFLLYLVFGAVAATLYVGAGRGNALFRFIARILRRAPWPSSAPAVETRPLAVRLGLLAALLVTFTAIVVSHQITPVFAILAIFVLTFLGFNRSAALPVLLLVIFLGYVVWGASNFWSGHLNDIFGGFSAPGGSLGQNLGSITSRVPSQSSSTPERAIIVQARIGMAVAMWLLVLVALIRDRSRHLVVPVLLAAAPVGVLALQSYGGEAILRVQLAAIPFACIVAAHAFGVSKARKRSFGTGKRVAAAVVGSVVAFALVIGFELARYGNESFEGASPKDVKTVNELYAAAPDGATILSLNDSMPWKDRKVGDYTYASLTTDQITEPDLAADLAPLRAQGDDAYLIVTDGAWNLELQALGVSSEQAEAFKQRLLSAPFVHQIYGDADSGVFLIDGSEA